MGRDTVKEARLSPTAALEGRQPGEARVPCQLAPVEVPDDETTGEVPAARVSTLVPCREVVLQRAYSGSDDGLDKDVSDTREGIPRELDRGRGEDVRARFPGIKELSPFGLKLVGGVPEGVVRGQVQLEKSQINADTDLHNSEIETATDGDACRKHRVQPDHGSAALLAARLNENPHREANFKDKTDLDLEGEAEVVLERVAQSPNCRSASCAAVVPPGPACWTIPAQREGDHYERQHFVAGVYANSATLAPSRGAATAAAGGTRVHPCFIELPHLELVVEEDKRRTNVPPPTHAVFHCRELQCDDCHMPAQHPEIEPTFRRERGGPVRACPCRPTGFSNSLSVEPCVKVVVPYTLSIPREHGLEELLRAGQRHPVVLSFTGARTAST